MSSQTLPTDRGRECHGRPGESGLTGHGRTGKSGHTGHGRKGTADSQATEGRGQQTHRPWKEGDSRLTGHGRTGIADSQVAEAGQSGHVCRQVQQVRIGQHVTQHLTEAALNGPVQEQVIPWGTGQVRSDEHQRHRPSRA